MRGKLARKSFYRGWPRQDIETYLLDRDHADSGRLRCAHKSPALPCCASSARRGADEHRGRQEVPGKASARLCSSLLRDF